MYLQLKASKIYSKSICENCNDQLNSFSNFQKDLIRNQLKLYKFEKYLNIEVEDFKTDGENEENDTVNYPNNKVFIKLESQQNEYYSPEDLLTMGKNNSLVR